MFDNPLFDTAIALVTLYLLFSQLTLSLVELPAGFLNTRGTYLYNRLREALGKDIHSKFYAAATIKSVSLPRKEKSPLLSLHFLRRWISLWPAYISETLFAQTVVACVTGPTPDASLPPIAQFKAGLDALPLTQDTTPPESHVAVSGRAGESSLPDSTFRGTLLTLYANAISVGSSSEEQSTALLRNLESWFHDFGERLTGRYKRDNRKYLFWTGLLVALLADVDSVRLARFLADSNNAKARAELVAVGVRATQGARPAGIDYDLNNRAQAAQYEQRVREWSAAVRTANTALQTTLAAIPPVGLPLGFLRWTNWNDTIKASATSPYSWAATADDYQMPAYAQRHVLNTATGKVSDAPGWHWLHMVGGWLLTAFALMLGAPFWFDTLCRFVNIRNVGIKPAPAAK